MKARELVPPIAELSRLSDPDHAAESERAPSPLRTVDQVERMLETYFAEHESVLTGPDARGAEFFQPGERLDADTLAVRQVVRDPVGHDEWGLAGWIDLSRSRDLGRAVLVFDELRRL